jgi:5-methylcytosine-specific restriction protein B
VLNDSVKAKENRFILLQQSAQLPSFSALFPKDIADSLSDRRFRINEHAFASAEASGYCRMMTGPGICSAYL